jgi:hypothetical protein
MSWGSGSALLIDIVNIAKKRLNKKITNDEFIELVTDITKLFEKMDCDTGDIYPDLKASDPLKKALDKLHPDWKDRWDD